MRIVEKHGLRIFGTKQHAEYDVGIVSLAHRLGDGFGKKSGMSSSGAPRQPVREDYEDEYEYMDAMEIWEDEMYDYEEDGFGGYGDLDKPIHRDHAYAKLCRIFHGEKC